MKNRLKSHGISLIELTIALVIVALMVAVFAVGQQLRGFIL